MATTTTDATPVPRNPGAYRPSQHFAERFKGAYDDHDRHLDGDIVAGCIQRGTASERDGSIYHLRETFGGVTYAIVVDVHKREVVTGHPVAIDAEAARNSGRWSSAQIEDIRAFLAAK